MKYSPHSHTPHWLVGLKAIAVFVLAILAGIGLLALTSAVGSFGILILVIVLALLIGALWAWFFGLFRRNKPDAPPFWKSWLRASTVWALALLALVSIPFLGAITFNAARPLALPRVELTDGRKEVVFQGMIHVGSEPFYQGVVFEVEKAADLGYTLLFEGVQPGTDENLERMNEILGTNGLNLNQIYDSFAQACGLRFQNEYFAVFVNDMKENPEQFVNADVSVDDMMAEWDRLLQEHPEWGLQQEPVRPEEEVDDRMSGFLGQLDNLTPGQQELVALACRTMMNLSFGNQGEQKPFNEHVVLNFRNEHLADAILEQAGNRIFVTYGAAHFPGVYSLLREADPNWKIIDVQWRQGIENRSRLEGNLTLEP